MHNLIDRASVSPFYADRLKGIHRWDQVPVTTREDLAQAYPFGLLAEPRSRIASYHESSGTTNGKPISSYFSEMDWEDVAERFLRNAIQLNNKDTFFIKTPYSMVTTAHQADRAARMAGAMIVPADNRSSVMEYPRVVQLLRDLDVTVTWSLPTEVLIWGYAAKANGINPIKDFPSLRGFIVAGESLSLSRRQAIEKMWGGVPVYEDYGSTETGSLAGDCVFRKLHGWADRILFEVQDSQSGEIRTQGEGKLLVTPLYREAMPLLRYCLGDYVKLNLNSCDCGSSFPCIEVLGRTTYRIQGKNYWPKDIEHALCLNTEINLYRVEWSDTELNVVAVVSDLSSIKTARENLSSIGIQAQVHGVSLNQVLDPASLTRMTKFQKPTYFFPKAEGRKRGINYV